MRSVFVIALLCSGSAMPALGRAHWEGYEAADPTTPAAVLRFDSAVSGYSTLEGEPLPWRTRFDGDSASPGTSDQDQTTHPGAATPATTQQ